MAITLGSRVRDSLTGFEGIATSRTDYLYGCTHIGVTPEKLDKDGKVQASEFFDEQRIEVLKKDSPRVSADSSARSGGPSLVGHPPA